MPATPPLSAALAAAAAIFGGFASLAAWASIFFSGLSLVCAVVMLRRKTAAPGESDPSAPVTVLKPLKGHDRGLYENLASFCVQDHARTQLILCLDAATDPAAETAERIRRDFPSVDIEVVYSKGRLGLNPKVSNLANAYPRVKHGIIVISDSDIRVEPDFIRRVVAEVQAPGVGLVTCFYKALAAPGLWSQLEGLAINARFLPQALMAAAFGMRFAMGAALVLRREAFEQAGGFPALADHLADDYSLGAAIQQAGWRLEFSRVVVDSVLGATGASGHLDHQLREARTIRLCQPAGYAGMILLHGFSLMTIKIALFGAAPGELALLAGMIAVRAATRAGVWLLLDSPRPPLASLWALPLAEWSSFAAWTLGLKPGPIHWRGRQYLLEPDGRLVPA